MQLILYSELNPTPWKNGGGETREIATFPPGAEFNDFDWRLSIATIAEDGAFSAFPGIDRTLILMSGNGVTLRLDNRAEHVLKAGDLLTFAGEQAVYSMLLDGTVQDLNVMLRRGRFLARIDRVLLRDKAALDPGIGGAAVVVREGQASLSDGLILGPGDTILCNPTDSGTITLTGEADLVLVRFRPVDQPATG